MRIGTPPGIRSQRALYFVGMTGALYAISAVAVSFCLLVLVLYPLRFSVTSDAVFGALAAVSIIAVDVTARLAMRRPVLISATLPFSILYVLLPLCLYVIVARPFE